MLFTFKRDDEGRERIYVGDVCVAELKAHDYDGSLVIDVLSMPLNATEEHIDDAIDRADEAGFWARSHWGITDTTSAWDRNEVTVDVPVADNVVLSVTTGEDES